MQRYQDFGKLILLFVVILSVGCGYPAVSPKTYQISKALYSACNLQNPEQLQKVAEVLEESLSSGEITEREAQWLRDIVVMGEGGQWQTATLQSRKLMEDQLR